MPQQIPNPYDLIVHSYAHFQDPAVEAVRRVSAELLALAALRDELPSATLPYVIIEAPRINDFMSSPISFSGSSGGGDWSDRAAADLGCGAGEFAAGLAARGARVYGYDSSAEMLARAERDFPSASYPNLHFIRTELPEFNAPEPLTACFALHDVVNHLTNAKAVRQLFENCYAQLEAGGCFVFDVLTERYARAMVATDLSYYLAEDLTAFFYNTYKAAYLTAEITLFLPVSGAVADNLPVTGTLWRRHELQIKQRIYKISALSKVLNDSGFRAVHWFALRHPHAEVLRAELPETADGSPERELRLYCCARK
ncbi:MAG: class I SAM-dependent methyltransferase [Clostridiaceae bacterium]|nr:class I SAM-dependent methyltransferase [Clostridiaceae bacterium]